MKSRESLSMSRTRASVVVGAQRKTIGTFAIAAAARASADSSGGRSGTIAPDTPARRHRLKKRASPYCRIGL